MEERELKIHGIYRHFKNKYYIVEDREPVAKRTNSRGEFVGESRSQLCGDRWLFTRKQKKNMWFTAGFMGTIPFGFGRRECF